MKRTLSGILVLCLLIAPVMMLMPAASAQTYTATAVLSTEGVEKNYFEPNDNILFTVTAYEDAGPLQASTLRLVVVGVENGVVLNITRVTDDYGVVAYSWNAGGGHDVDRYTLYVNYSGIPIATVNFRIYVPVLWSATVETYLGDTPTNIFREWDWVSLQVAGFDQHGNPYAPGGWWSYYIGYNVTRDGDMFRDGYTITMSSNTGLGSTGFSVWDSGNYVVNLFDAQRDLGSTTFTVVYLEMGVSPQRAIYSQGQDITLEVMTSLEGSYTVNMTNETGVLVVGASWTVTGEDWEQVFTLPSTMRDGIYRVSVWQNNLEMGQMFINVRKFTLMAHTDRTVYLPGGDGTLFYTAISNLDASPLSVTVTVDLEYRRDDGQTITVPVRTSTGSSGSIDFRMPVDARTNRENTLIVKADSGAGHTSEIGLGVWSGNLELQPSTDAQTYMPGDPMIIGVRAVARAGGRTSPVKSVEISVRCTVDDVNVAWLSNDVVTGTDGRASFVVTVPSDAAEKLHTINFTGIFARNRDLSISSLHDFAVDATPNVYIILRFDRTRYFSGETVEVSYRIMSGSEETNGMVAYNARIGDIMIDTGHSDEGAISIVTPVDIEGTLTVDLMGMTGEREPVFITRTANIVKAQLVAFASKNTYMPGDVMVFTYSLQGDTIQSVVCTISDASWETVMVSNPTDGSVSFTTPTTEPSTRYNARFVVQGQRSVYEQWVNVDLVRGYTLTFSMDKNYYKPGEVVTFTYEITAVGDPVEAASGFNLEWGLMGQENILWTEEMSGTASMTLPDDINDGVYIIMFDANSPNSNVFVEGGGIRAITVDSSAGGLMYGTTMGMATGTLLSLLIGVAALILAVVFGVLYMKGRSPGRPKDKKPKMKKNEQAEAPAAKGWSPPENFNSGEAPEPDPFSGGEDVESPPSFDNVESVSGEEQTRF